MFFWLGFWVLLLGFLHDVVELVAVDAGFVEGVAASAVPREEAGEWAPAGTSVWPVGGVEVCVIRQT